VRPLELTLEGFKSYRKAQTFTFESRTLFGIVGPTGSGKSSILEGLIFALYGKTPSVKAGTTRLINSQEAQARVQLSFEADDIAWEVVRVLRIKGTSQVVLRRLDGTGDTVTGDRQVTERIGEIVGLDFEAFRSSVSLPQGEFDRFLMAAPTERSRILKGIFRLERVDLLREAAKARWQAIEREIAGLRGTLDALPEQPELLLARLAEEESAARAVLAEVRIELPKVVQAEQDVRRSVEDLERVRTERAATETALRRLPPEESLRNLADARDSAERRLKEAAEAFVNATRALEAAEAGQAEVVAATGGEAWFAGVESGLGARRRITDSLASAERERASLEAELDLAAGRLPSLKSAVESAESTLADARAALNALQQRHGAHLLRADLAEGEPCPVCEQPVETLPVSFPLPAMSQAKDGLAGAESRFKAAHSSFDAADRAHGLVQERLRLASGNCDRLAAELEEVEGLLLELAPGVENLPAELAAGRSRLAAAHEAVAKARTARESADVSERRARRELEDLAHRSREATNLLSHTSGLLGIPSVAPDEEGLWDAAKRVLEAGAARVEDLQRQSRRLQAAAETATRLVDAFRSRFDAGPQDQAANVLVRAENAVTRLELRIEELKLGMEKRKQIEAQLAALVGRRGRFDRLIADFADSKFTAYLLDEQRRLLSRLGSEKFVELTGHYTFDDEGQFQIVDQRTGVTRTPDTLSGGETFLASLSLALALSEAVALEGGRLGCFFLDEGFGSLDQESLDLALEGIEKLADPGRLIGLISHIPGVQARLDDLIILERGADGSTEVAQHEGPIGYASLLV
jgi:exonuclease SbcC